MFFNLTRANLSKVGEMVEVILRVAVIFFAVICLSLSWLFFDALRLRFEIKTFLRLLGFLMLGIGFGGILTSPSVLNTIPFLLWIKIVGLYAIFVSYAFDAHSKFQIALILGIVLLIFLKDHQALAVIAFLTALTVFQLAYSTKHRDLIPMGTGFILIAIAEFFRSIETMELAGLSLASAFLYIFASVSFFLWMWQYLIIRFNIKKSRLT